MQRSRRDLLFGGFRKVAQIKEAVKKGPPAGAMAREKAFTLRPPGAVPEEEFKQLCAADCVDCLTRCPVFAIQKEQDPASPNHGTAFLDADMMGCIWCKDFPCTNACKLGALLPGEKPMGSVMVLGTCITKQLQHCEYCFDACPEGVTALKKDKQGILQVDTEQCIGCGRCVASCILTPRALEMIPAPPQS